MAFPFTIYILAISVRAMYEFLIVLGVIHIGVGFLLTVAHIKPEKGILMKVGKGLNVGLTIVCFFNIFASDLAGPSWVA